MRRASLRTRTGAVVAAIVIAPLAVVAVADRLGAGEAERAREAVAGAAADAAEDFSRDGDASAAAERAAARASVRVLVLDARGVPLARADHDAATSLRDRIGDAMFGPEGAPTLRAYDEVRPDAASWSEVQQALRDGRSAGCAVVLSGVLSVCHTGLRAGSATDPVVVLAQKSAPRAIRALFDLRYPLLKLTLYVLVIAALLAVWLARKLVGPVERLRGEVLRRVADPLAAPPIAAVSNDEIGELGEAFNALLGALAARSRANEAFAADLAHELKSPIAALRACADTVRGPMDEVRAQRLASILRESTARLDGLVSRFLEIARAEAGLPEDARTPIDLGALARAICDALASDERYARVRFDVEAPEPLEVLGVVGPLEAALRNVLDNAASFAVSAAGAWVRVRVRRDGGFATVEVADSGPGIAPESLPKIFQRFFTDRAGGRGTGLGLAYAKAVVEAHGGAITAASEPGAGAVFTLRLPVGASG